MAIGGGEALVAVVVTVALITGEEFVGALAGENYGDMLAGEAADEIERNAGGPGDGFVFVMNELGESAEEIGRAHADFVVLRAEGGSGLAGISEFAVTGFRVAD